MIGQTPLAPAGSEVRERGVSTVAQVIAAVKEGIKDARYAPGQRIIEPQLMRELGVSRGSVREGLQRLAAEGFVQWERYRGAKIIRMSRRQVIDFLDLREIIEGHAARLAASEIDKPRRAALIKLQASTASKSFAPIYYDEYNNKFHALILEACGNAELPALLNQVKLPIMRLQFNRILLHPDQIEISRIDHIAIVEKILGGNGTAAEAAMRKHIRHSAECILRAPPAYFD